MSILRKIIVILVLVAILAAAGIFVGYKMGWIGNSELKIDKTANVVTSIKKIAEFVSMNYYEEFILTKEKVGASVDNSVSKKVLGWFGKKATDVSKDQLVIIAKGNVRAGFNLTKVAEEDIHVSNDTLTMALPPAEILDVTINPSGFEIFYEDGKWNHEQVKALENEGIASLKAKAEKAGIIEKAEKNGIEQLQSMYKAMGFKEVICTIKTTDISAPADSLSSAPAK